MNNNDKCERKEWINPVLGNDCTPFCSVCGAKAKRTKYGYDCPRICPSCGACLEDDIIDEAKEDETK